MAVKVLFVCMGNICRSPAGEAIFLKLVAEAHLSASIQVDSAGTSAYHVGEKADPRMRAHALRRGVDIQCVSRAFDPGRDFREFDYILAADQRNLADLLKHPASEEERKKVRRMTDFCRHHDVDHVPDPYYGGDQGFEHVLDILEDACEGLLAHVRERHGL